MTTRRTMVFMVYMYCVLAVGFSFVVSCVSGTPLRSDMIDMVRSDVAGLRMAPISPIPWKAKKASSLKDAEDDEAIFVSVDATIRMQTISGFGASVLESGAMNLNALPASKQDEILRLIFSPEGAHFSLLKVPMLCNDFCAAANWSTYDDVEGDLMLKHFSIARDLRANGTLTLLKRAIQYGFAGKIQSYMDYPPDWMLIGDLPDEATVNPKYYDVLASYYAKFVQAYHAQNVTIAYLSLFNEPIDSYTNINDGNMTSLLGDHVGPLFDKLGLLSSTKLTYGGQATREWAEMHISAQMNHSKAAKYMQYFAYHGYDKQYRSKKREQHYDAIASLRDHWPDHEMLMTEICYAYNGEDSDSNCSSELTLPNCTEWPRDHTLAPPLPRLDFQDGAIWGSRLVSDIEAGASGWIYWNLLLSKRGGPFLLSPTHNDGPENLQQAVIHISLDEGTIHTTGLFWYLSHFSRYVRPGSVRVGAHIVGSNGRPDPDRSEGTSGTEVIAFRNDSHVILQLLNHDSRDRRVVIEYGGRQAPVELTAISITTAFWVV